MNPAPNPIDVQDIQFKQSNTHQVCEEFKDVPTACSLLATDAKRGLVYIGHDNKLTILKPETGFSKEWKIELELPFIVCRIALNCDYSYLAVTTSMTGTLIYNASALCRNTLELLHVITLSPTSSEAFVRDLQWNPTIADMFCIVESNHGIGNLQLKGDKKIITAGPMIEALCVAWSPKGKQIVVGCKNGDIVQFKPDFKLVRTIKGPSPNIGEIIALLWLSNYQFCAAYLELSERRINVLIIDAPKGEKSPIFTYYEDVTYGMPDSEGQGSIPRYYLEHIQEWNLIVAASSGSSEVALLGSSDNGTTWLQWTPGEGSRAELPLKSRRSHTESYPVGLTIDKSSVEKLPWGTDSSLPHPVPKLHVLGTSGQLCSFHIVNLTQNCPPICMPPTEDIPVPPTPRPSIVPSEVSFTLPNLTATSTPRPKPGDTHSEHPKALSATNLFGNIGSHETGQAKTTGFSLSAESKQPAKSYEIQQQPTVHEPGKVDAKLPPVKDDTVPSKDFVQQKNGQSIIDDTICMRAYADEQALFEKELKSRFQQPTWDCGTAEERNQLGEKSAAMDEFLRELRETTNGLSSDIAYLKALLLQTFAWVEETKSKNTASTCITPRNHGTTAKITELKRLYYYAQSQLSQATKVLDLEWSEHKSHERSRMKIPSSEYLYQTLVKHNKIIIEEKKKIEYLTKKWKMLNRTTGLSGLNNSMSNLHLASPKTINFSYSSDTGIIEARCKAIALKTLNFTCEKQTKLKNSLSRSTPRIIKPVNPSPVQDRLEATLSCLASSGIVTTETKTKTEQPISKQITYSKPVDDKIKSQSPLASLNSIVARIGTSEKNNTQLLSQSQNKLFSPNNTFASPVGSQFSQLDKKTVSIVSSTNTPITTVASSNTSSVTTGCANSQLKETQEITSTLNHVNTPSHNIPALKNFPKVDSISFGSLLTKGQEIGNTKLQPKDMAAKNDGPTSVMNSENSAKMESNLFAYITQKEATKTQSVTNGSLSTALSTLKTAESPSTFSFASANTSSLVKNTPIDTVPGATSNPQILSFPPKPTNAFCFDMKTNTTAASTTDLQGTPTLPALTVQPQTPTSTTMTSEAKIITANGTTAATSTFSFAKPPSAPSVSILRIPLTSTPQSSAAAAPNVSVVPVTITTFGKMQDTSAMASAINETTPNLSIASRIGSPNQTRLPTTSIFGGSGQTSIVSTSTFGQPTSCTSSSTTATIFGSSMPGATFGTSGSVPIFGGFSETPTTKSPFNTLPPMGPIASTIGTVSPTFASPAKSTFENTKTTSTIGFTGCPTSSTSAITFGTTGTSQASIVPTFNNVSLSPQSTNTQFPVSAASVANIFAKAATSSASALFGKPPSTSIFSGTSSNTIFGGKSAVSTAPSIFSTTSSSTPIFGATSSGSIFEGNTAKPGLVFGETSSTGSTSPFGGLASGTPIMTGTGAPSIGSSTSLVSPQPAFGAAPAFGGKPVFGNTPSVFDASKPVFGSGFGTTFGVTDMPGGFGSPPSMGASSPALSNTVSKVFGGTTGSSTFESLAGQSGGLTFGSLAQKSPEPEKPPAFSGGSSFSSWR